MDPISLAVGGGVFLFGWLVGRASRRTKSPKPPALECSCTHGYGMHEAGGRCHGIAEHYVGYGEYDRHDCRCQGYDGPEPLPRAWVSELPAEVKKEIGG